MPILDAVAAEVREHMANDPAWGFNEKGEPLLSDNHFAYHGMTLLLSRITTTDDAKAVMAELIDHWPVVSDVSLMGREDDWIEWVACVAYEVLLEYFDNKLNRPAPQSPDPPSD